MSYFGSKLTMLSGGRYTVYVVAPVLLFIQSLSRSNRSRLCLSKLLSQTLDTLYPKELCSHLYRIKFGW